MKTARNIDALYQQIDALKNLLYKPSVEEIAIIVCGHFDENGDNFSVRRQNPHKVKGKYWRLMSSNDNPLQHGNGGIDVFIEERVMLEVYELLSCVGQLTIN